MEALTSWIEVRFKPVVLVAGTPAAEGICQHRNGLSITDILRARAHVAGLNGAFRLVCCQQSRCWRA